MPAPIEGRRRYMPGLDGLRAIAVLGVIGYHLGFARAQGGLLGVGVFFTLSGYLITDILLGQIKSGGISLKAFWFARARRLLPALFLVLVVVMAWVTVIGPHQPSDFRLDIASAAAYFNNWWQIAGGSSYFAQFEAPGPLNHLWSLSIEEQFYIAWPLLLLGASMLVPRLRTSTRPHLALAGLSLALALASAALMATLYTPGLDPSRVYYGTDTRVQELLVGAALAMIWPSQRLRANLGVGKRRALDAAGTAGLVVVGVMFLRANEFSPFLYRGGFLLLAFATALAVAAMAHPSSRLGPIVGCAPMRWIGERSYGIYLWHFPVIILTTPGGIPLATDKPLAALQVAATFLLAALSWRYVENPIRHGALGRLWAGARARGWRRPVAGMPRRAWPALALAGVVTVVAGAGMAGANVQPPSETPDISSSIATTVTAPGPGKGEPRTSCDSVVHIGDSTSLALVEPGYVPDRKQIIPQYGRVGVTTQHFEISGGISIYEPYLGPIPNAANIARHWIGEGFDGCWVLAVGLNDAANVSLGSPMGYEERIESMISAIGDQPILWVNVKTVNASGPYSEANMQAWNAALVQACAAHPDMRIYDWASDVPDEAFGTDGAHWDKKTDIERGRWIADALLKAFPANADDSPETPGCLIDLPRGADASAAAG
ncbi:MAG: acyltransferase family protein [Solirubrobacterales bacterium]